MALINQGGKLLLRDGMLGSGANCCCKRDCSQCVYCSGTVNVGGVAVNVAPLATESKYTLICVRPLIDPPATIFEFGSALGWARAFYSCATNASSNNPAIHLRVEIGAQGLRNGVSDEEAYSSLVLGQEADSPAEFAPFNITATTWTHLLRYGSACTGGELQLYDSLPFPLYAPADTSNVFPCFEQAIMNMMAPITASLSCGANPFP